MSSSRVPQVIDYLVEALTAALPDVDVHDGPAGTASARPAVLVGVDDPAGDGAFTAARSSSSWASLGRQARDEDLTVWLSVVADNGGDVKAARDQVFAVLAEVEAVVLADPTLDGLVRQVAGLDGAELRTYTDDTGVTCTLTAAVRAVARI